MGPFSTFDGISSSSSITSVCARQQMVYATHRMKHLLSGYLCCLKNTSICVVSSSGCGPLMLGETGMPAAAASCSSAVSRRGATGGQQQVIDYQHVAAICFSFGSGYCTTRCEPASVLQVLVGVCLLCFNSPSASATKQPKIATAGTRDQCSSVSAAGDMILDSTGDSRGSSGWLPSSCACKTVRMRHSADG
eukprot:GHRQ01023882.1.p1 GENE.GHRQ01023882.1~~GHRQ01023882.1.p1  ORF type:complete len:192 (+),score=23.20 GHRQ01023882.1:314-889(+)